MTEQTHENALPEDEILAAEYVLGVLSGPERSAVEARLTSDFRLATDVANWEERLAHWTDELPPVTPSPWVWSAIAAQLPSQERGLRRARWSFWEGFATASVLACACLAFAFFWVSGSSEEPLFATISAGGQGYFVATLDPRMKSVMVVPAGFKIPADKTPELWVIATDGKPRALGLLSASNAVSLTISAELKPSLRRNTTLAVSLEPPGGSPTDLPTGPVIGTGKLTGL